MHYRPLHPHETPQAVDIFHHEHLRYMDGTYPESSWIEQFITSGYARVIATNDKVMAALIAEPLLAGGVYLWLIAVRPEDIGKGYGQQLLTAFLQEMEALGKSWVFLTSFAGPETFYLRNGFLTAGLAVKEYCKVL